MFGKWLFALLAPLALAATLSACNEQGVQPGVQTVGRATASAARPGAWSRSATSRSAATSGRQ